MSNIPENTEQQLENAEANASEQEFSTVFSDPTEHKKTSATPKKKKRLPVAIASVLAVAMLIGGTVAVVKLIPEKEEDTPPASELGNIEVLNMDSDDFKTVTVTNTNGTFKLYSEKQTSDSDSSNSTEITNWYLDGYDKELLSTSRASSPVSAVSVITASREITEKTAAECGLENPTVKADVITADDGEFSVLIGADSPDNSGCYLKLSTSDKIYLVDSSVKSELVFDALYFANTDTMPAFPLTDDMGDYKDDSGALATFDSLTISGKNFPEKVVIVPNKDSLISQYAAFVITSPIRKIADNVDSLFTLFKSGLSVTGAYSYDTSAASLKTFGLDSPDFVATMSIKGKTLTYKFKLQEDGGYAASCDGERLIKKVSADSLGFINYRAKDLYSSWVCLNNISDLKGFSVKTPDKTYEFGITPVEDEESENDYIITYNGETIDTDKFKDFYQECISLACNDFTVDSLTEQPEYVITFDFNDDIGGKNVIEFVKSSATKYQYYSDGVAGGKVTASSLKKIIKSLTELVGEQ